MSDELLALIPEFDLIEDSALRQQCIETWKEAMRRG
jgi:hypothetical protein